MGNPCAPGCACHSGLPFVHPTPRRIALAAFGAALLTMRAPGLARAQTAGPTIPGRSTRLLERHEVAGTDEDMSLVEVTFAPGVASPLHHHPVPGLNFIIEGVAESAYANDQPRLYRAGESLQDLANVPHTLFRNPDATSRLRFLIFYVLGRDQPYLIVP